MVLDEGDCGLERFLGFLLVLHHHFTPLFLHFKVEIGLHIGRQPEHQTHDKTYAHLSHNLVFALQTLLVVLENLYKIVHSTEKTEPYGGDNHQQQINVAQSTEQEHRHKQCHDDYYAAHRRHSNLIHSPRVELLVALRLGNLLALEVLDEMLSEPCGDAQSEYHRQ